MTTKKGEIWRQVEGWPYEVSNLGRARRKGSRRLRKLSTIRSGGYPALVMSDGKRRRCESMHRLVCIAFHGPPTPPRDRVRHKDGKRKNCAETNLAWSTQKENMADTLLHGTRLFGERHPNARLTDAQVDEIRLEWARRDPHCTVRHFIRRMMDRYPAKYGMIEDLIYRRRRSTRSSAATS